MLVDFLWMRLLLAGLIAMGPMGAEAAPLRGGAAQVQYVGPDRWVVTRGDLHNGILTATGSNTRYMGHKHFIATCDVEQLRMVLSNFYQNAAASPNQEISNPDSVPLSAVAVAVGSNFAKVKFSGGLTVSISGGASGFLSDIINPGDFGFPGGFFPKNTDLDARLEGNMASGTAYVPVGSKINIGPTDQMFWFNPVNDNPQVYATGAMVAPSGASSPAIFMPDGFIGKCRAPSLAFLNIGDSIGDGGDDTAGIGLNGLTVGSAGNINGGGAMRRSATNLGIAFLNMTTGGDRLVWQAGGFGLRANYFPYFTNGFSQAGDNDAAGGSSAATISAAGCTLYQGMFTGGITNGIWQTLIDPKKGGSDNFHQTDLVNQVDIPGYDTIRAGLNGNAAGSFASKVGATCHLNGVIDIEQGVQDAVDTTSWGVKNTVNTTLSNSPLAGVTTFQTVAAPHVSDILVLNPGGVNADVDQWVTNVTGSGPFTVTLAGALVNNHSAGETVRDTGNYDGTHKTPVNHIIAAGILNTLQATIVAPN